MTHEQLELVRANLVRLEEEYRSREGTDEPPTPEEVSALRSAWTMYESYKAADAEMSRARELNKAAVAAIEAGDMASAKALLNESTVRLFTAAIEHHTIEDA